jgi:hypothetical protein
VVVHGLVAVPCLVNAVARRLNGGGSWVGGSPCLVNAVVVVVHRLVNLWVWLTLSRVRLG